MRVEPVEETKLRQRVQGIVETQEALRGNVADALTAVKSSREFASFGDLPHLSVGGHVVVARVTREGRHRNLVSTVEIHTSPTFR